MNVRKIIKVAGLNLGIAVINTILFSPGFIGVSIGGESVLKTAFGATEIFMSVVIFIFGNYKLFSDKKEIIKANEINNLDECKEALKQNCRKIVFEDDVSVVLEQIEGFRKKEKTINDILLQKFDLNEMSYSKFNGAIKDVEKVFCMNIKSIINKINAFDEEDYKRISKDNVHKKFSKEFINTKMGIYGEFISFVKNAMEDNEQIILKLDKLLLEISKFNSLEDGELENMTAIKEIEELTGKTQLYK